MSERCEYSDLLTTHCGHCLGHAAIDVEPSPVEPIRAPGRVAWSPSHDRNAQDAISRPRAGSMGQSSTAVVSGPQNGQNECACGKPTRDNAVLCDNCTDELDRALGNVPSVVEELDISITGQRSAPIVFGSPSATLSLPWHEMAAEAMRELRTILVLWTRLCAEEGVGSGPTELPADNLPAISRWLMHKVAGLAHHDAGQDALDEITNAIAECERVIFWKRRSRTYLGPCGQRVEDEEGVVLMDACAGEVYAEEGAAVGACEDCKQGVTVVIRQSELNRQLDDRLCTAAELARLATILGLDAPRDAVRKKINYWHRHKRITSRGTVSERAAGTIAEAPTFRYGEVRVMLYAEFSTSAS